MTHLTSTCPNAGRAGLARTRPHFLCRWGPRGPRPAPRAAPRGSRAGAHAHARPRRGRPRTAAVPAAGPGRGRGPPLAPGPPPQRRSNPARPGEDARAASSLPGPREETPRLPWLRPAAEGAGAAYPRQQRPSSAGAPTCGAEEAAGPWQVQRAAAAAQPGTGTA